MVRMHASVLRCLGLGLRCLLVVSVGLAGERDALAEADRALSFAWTAPDGCPSAAEVRAEIDKLLGDTAQAHVRERLTVEASVTHDEKWTVAITTQSATSTGRRAIEAATCQALANAAALIVALAIDPDAVAARAALPPRREQPAQAAPVPVMTPAQPPTAGVSKRRTFGVAGLVATGSLGVVPALDVALGAELGLVRGGWRLELRAAYGLRTVDSAPVSATRDAHGRFRFFAGNVVVCRTWAWQHVQLGPCTDLAIGAVHGQGIGADKDESATTLWLAWGAGLVAVAMPNHWLRIPLHLDVVAPLHRPTYAFGGLETPIFSTWRVGGRLTAGVEVQF
jgi:hypothetical protein